MKFLTISKLVVLFILCGAAYYTFEVRSATTSTQLSTVYVNANSSSNMADGSQSNPFYRLSDAIDVAGPGANIFVSAGKYAESLRIQKEIHIHGDPNQQTHIIGSLSEESIIRFEASGSVENLNLIPDQSLAGYEDIELPIGIAIRVPAENVEIRRSRIEGCAVGIEAAGSRAQVTIDNVTVTKNRFGIGAPHNEGRVLINNSSIIENFTGLFSSETNVNVTNSRVEGNRHGIHVGTRDVDENEYLVGVASTKILRNKITGLWFDQGTKSLKTAIDIGGGSVSAGNNEIGDNGTYDIFNQTRGGIISAKSNNFVTRKFANGGEGSRILIEETDGTPPAIELQINETRIATANKSMIPIHVSVTANDEDKNRPIVVLADIESSDPEYDASNPEDVPIDIQNADFRSEDTDFSIRAEVGKSSSDRIYTITYIATDSNGNSSSARRIITVNNN